MLSQEERENCSPERLTAAEVTFIGICFSMLPSLCSEESSGGSSSSVFKDKMELCKIFSDSDLWIHFLCIDCFTGNLLSSGKPKEMDDGEGNECLGRPVNIL